MIFVDAENATFADPFAPLTSIVVPDTESIDPLTSSSPLTFAGAWDAAAADVMVDVVDVSLGELLLDEPQATADSAVIPTIAKTE
jgi:hypothetical protein